MFMKKISQKIFVKAKFPNPFNGQTMIEYSIPSPSNILFKIFDMNGKEIRTLHNGYHNSGRAAITWDGKDKN